jgi:hypothetical protein
VLGASRSNNFTPGRLSASFGCTHRLTQSAILYTIVENCRRLGIHTREYLEDVLTRLPAMKAREAASLTPAKWLAARPARAARQAA